MKIRIALFGSASLLKEYDASTPPSGQDVVIVEGRGYDIVGRSLYLDNVTLGCYVIVKPMEKR